MKLNVLFVITAVIAFVFGILFLIIPTQMYSLYGLESYPPLNYMGRLFGAALLAIGIISWQSRNVTYSDCIKNIILSFFIADGIGFLIALFGQFNGVINALGWLTVVIYLFLTIGFGYFSFFKSGSKES